MIERRTRKRFVGRHEVLIRAAMDMTEGTGIPAYTYDLSTGGARLVCDREFPTGTVIRVRIKLAKTGHDIALDGKVKWLKHRAEEGYEFGVEFMSLTSPAVLALIRELYGSEEGIPVTVS
jgi:c-di-GMP-binding flagellar brake protein YcgR